MEEHEDEWVEQQIRKGTNVPTAAAVERGPGQLNEEQMAYIEQYQQQLQNQQQQYMESSFTQRQAALPVNLPKLDVEQVAKDLQNRSLFLPVYMQPGRQDLLAIFPVLYLKTAGHSATILVVTMATALDVRVLQVAQPGWSASRSQAGARRYGVSLGSE